ncbi:MAG: hypothetical protein GY799_13405 [Desulfobulbaceae bacterium]|nr:hypothetical protein [Desulfobulbaceae bacterium]
MKLYIYDAETNEVVATATGETNEDCENKAFNYLGVDEYAGTYTPAFGTANGLIENEEAEIL